MIHLEEVSTGSGSDLVSLGAFKIYAPLSEDSGALYRPVAATACGTATAADDFPLRLPKNYKTGRIPEWDGI